MSNTMMCPRCKGAGAIEAPSGLGSRLNILRDAHGVTGTAIEKATGISHATLFRIMRGGSCTVPHLVALADFFHVSVDDLIGRSL